MFYYEQGVIMKDTTERIKTEDTAMDNGNSSDESSDMSESE
jgi:hypothetical protein